MIVNSLVGLEEADIPCHHVLGQNAVKRGRLNQWVGDNLLNAIVYMLEQEFNSIKAYRHSNFAKLLS